MINLFRKPIIEESDVLSPDEVLESKRIISEVNWEYTDRTTSYTFPQYSHLLVSRPSDFGFYSNTKPNIVSEHYDFFIGILDRFCKKHKIQYKNVIRSCLNKPIHVPGYPHTDPHIDYPKDHYVALLYLTDNQNSPTLIFDKLFRGKNTKHVEIADIKIKRSVIPETGKICLFDGKYFHANVVPKLNETRIVCVFNLLK